MSRPNHLHSGSGLLLATVALLVAGVGVVQAQLAPDVAGDPPPALVAAADPPPPSTTVADAEPTTTTTGAVTTTTAAPAPPLPPPARATTTTTAPRPRPTATTAPAAPPSTEDGPTYAMRLVREVVPPAWLAAVPVHVKVIDGKTSWSSWGGLIQIGDWHLFSSVPRAKNTLAHEWGHQVAWHYGTDVYNGAPPAGFPYAGRIGEEQWADCVAEALTGTSYPTSGLPPCTAAARSFTRSWLAAAPGKPLR